MNSINIARHFRSREVGAESCASSKKAIKSLIEQNIVRDRFAAYEIPLERSEKVLGRKGRFIATYTSFTNSVSMYDIVARRKLWECVASFERHLEYRGIVSDTGSVLCYKEVYPWESVPSFHHYFSKGREVYKIDCKKYKIIAFIKKSQSLCCIPHECKNSFDIIDPINRTSKIVRTKMFKYDSDSKFDVNGKRLAVITPNIKKDDSNKQIHLFMYDFETKSETICTIEQGEYACAVGKPIIVQDSVFFPLDRRPKGYLYGLDPKLLEFDMTRKEKIREYDPKISLGNISNISVNDRYVAYYVGQLEYSDGYVWVYDRKDPARKKKFDFLEYNYLSVPKISLSGNLLYIFFSGKNVEMKNVFFVFNLKTFKPIKTITHRPTGREKKSFEEGKFFLSNLTTEESCIYIEDYLNIAGEKTIALTKWGREVVEYK